MVGNVTIHSGNPVPNADLQVCDAPPHIQLENFKETSHYILYHGCVVTPSTGFTAPKCHRVRLLGKPRLMGKLFAIHTCIIVLLVDPRCFAAAFAGGYHTPTFGLPFSTRIQWTSTERFALRLVTDEVLVLDGQKPSQLLSRIQVQHLSQLMISPSFAEAWRWMGDGEMGRWG